MWAGWSSFTTGCAKTQMNPPRRKPVCPPPKCKPKKHECPPSHHHGRSGKVTIKTLVVVAQECVQKVGHLEIPAPPGVGFNHEDRELTHEVHLEPIGYPAFDPVVLKDKLINEGFIRARLIVVDADPNPCPDVRKFTPKIIEIPFQSVHDIPGIRPGDHVQEFSEVEGLVVSGASAPTNTNSVGNCAGLKIKAILKVKVFVARECLVEVPASDVHCMPPRKKLADH